MVAVYSETIPRKAGYYVYRLWAAGETCLYVGCVGERGPKLVTHRLSHHKRKPWWPQVARIEVAALAGVQEVADEERAQIAQLRPVHNGNLLGQCVNGHDTTSPSARYASGACKQCQREVNAVRDRAKARAYNARPDVKLRRAATARAYRRRATGPGQPALW